ncbi:MAG: LemA family protein [Sphaerochaeta sp.]|jgi:LemA protein|nr:LemA family protein [Sphaerochaeta sp.]MCH3919580.1 LemA family protein [Sphaerochaeta sp.]MCI2045469.1 LemA family protein [Sphaerochaeta sp.]MCI2096386.1 LemA family protein [Sphaerochaeta sp.]MCI2104244.1 LemA family protein [Sphaerochaeta sp.]
MVLTIIIVIVVLLLLYGVSIYNKLIRYRNQSEEAAAAIDAHLKQRYDLVPNLVETVKGYATHEKETFSAVIAARNAAMGAKTMEEKDQANQQFSSTLKSLFAVAEAYPELKANANFMDLQKQLQKIEGDLLEARKYYNAVIKHLNTMIEVFPSNIIASMAHFTKFPYLSIEEEAKQNVKVSF